MDLQLKDKVAVITGGSIGIGLAIAEGLAAEGVHLVLAARQADRVQAEATRIAGHYGVRAIAVTADVGTTAGCAAIVQAAEAEFQGADLLINNAGSGRPPRPRPGPRDAPARRWRHPAQRLHLRCPALVV